jgi:hypothetical protein
MDHDFNDSALQLAHTTILMLKASLKMTVLRAESAEEKIRKDADAAARTNKRKGDVPSHTSWGSSPSELQFDHPAGCASQQVTKSLNLPLSECPEPEPQADGYTDGFCLSTSAASASAGLMKAVRDVVQLDKDVVMYNEYVAKNYKTGPYHSFENWKRFVSDDAY